MKNKLPQFVSQLPRLAWVIVFLLLAYPPAQAQPSGSQRPNTPAQDRDLQVKVMRSGGGALDGRGKLWAVSIGVSSYKNLKKEEQLEFAHRDAEAFAAFLRSPRGGGFPSSQLTVLTNQAATLSAMRSSLGTILPRSVEPDDMVIIFFAGHGVVEGERDGYLLAYDSDPQNLYATALQVSELNRIISERLKARTVILIADACHSGQLGWTSRSAGESAMLVNRYLDEVGKSGKGVFRLLASRADQRSYEGKNWGGGHGCFTWFLLEGLNGKADRDGDGVVRTGELLDYLSENVPKATQALQHPRAAGDIDARLPLAVLSVAATKTGDNVTPAPSTAKPGVVAEASRENSGARPGDPSSRIKLEVSAAPDSKNSATPQGRLPQLVRLEVNGAPGLKVYLGSTLQGSVPANGTLLLKPFKAGEYELSIVHPDGEAIKQKLSLTAAKTIVNVKLISASPLVVQIKQLLSSNNLRSAVALYQQLVKDSPQEPQRASLEADLSRVLEATGQNAINLYVQSRGKEMPKEGFQAAAEAFQLLKQVKLNADLSIDAKLLFCEGKAKLEERLFAEAIERFNRAIALDPRAAYAHSALGAAFRNQKKDPQALEAFKRAAELAPSWALPQLQLGFLYRDLGNRDKAKEAFQTAARFEPPYPDALEQLMLMHLVKGELREAEQKGKEILGKFPNSSLAHLWLGQIYEQSNRWELAVGAYETGLRIPSEITAEQRADFLKRIERCRKKMKN